MYAFKGHFGRYQQLRQVASALSNTPWHQKLSSSTVRADIVDEEPAFGLLSSDPSSEFYEKKRRGQGKSYSRRSIPFDEGVSEVTEEEHLSSKRHESRQTKLDNWNASTPASRVHKFFHQKHSLRKWHEFKSASNEKMQKSSRGLVADDDEEDYIRYELFNERFDGPKGNYAKESSSIDESSLKLDASPKAQILLDEEPFGQLSPAKNSYEDESGDEGDEAQRKYEEAKLERRHKPAYYGNQMKKLCRERKLADALRILEVEMPAVAAKPDRYCYQVLINACGRAGYTKKAFQLYNDMKKRGLEIQHVAYTGLFNACANSPWPLTDGLSRAQKLRKQLKEKGYALNQTTSHAMIKAFGRCGDIKTAFLIVDEMLEQGLVVSVETVNFMLQACITDRETGFRHALMVWRKMRELKLRPDVYSYNLLVRCVSSCNAGDPMLTTQLLESGSKPSENVRSKKADNSRAESNVTSPKESPDAMQESREELETGDSENAVNRVEILSGNDKLARIPKKVPGEDAVEAVLPNLLGRKMTVGSAVGLTSLEKSEDRLALLGGPAGLITQMQKDKVTPDLKTVTQLLESLPLDLGVEESLLQSMKIIGLAPDTQFCNMLIRKRSLRFDVDSAKDVLILMQEYSLKPDLITFGCLALGCGTLHVASEFLSDMDAAGFRPNVEIMTALVKNSVVKANFYYTHEMLREMRNRGVSPDEKLLEILEKSRNKAREIILKMDSRKDEPTKEERRQLDYTRLFLLEYRKWLNLSEVQLDDHPWAQYRSSEEEQSVQN